MCVLSIKVPIQKKSGNLFNDPNDHIYIYIYIYIYTNPSAQAGCDTRSIFQQSLTGLNSDSSFS